MSRRHHTHGFSAKVVEGKVLPTEYIEDSHHIQSLFDHHKAILTASAISKALANELGCYEDTWFETAYTVCGPNVNAEMVRYYFGPETPFRFVAPGGWHGLIIEELEELHRQTQRLANDAMERILGNYKLVVAATSNDASRLVLSFRRRFRHYVFSGGTCFAGNRLRHSPKRELLRRGLRSVRILT